MKILISKLLNKISPRSINEHSVHTKEICLEENIISRPAIYLPSNLNNLMSCIPGSNFALENDRLLGKSCRHFATTLYELKNVEIQGEYLISNFRSQRYVTNRPWQGDTDRKFFEDGFLSTNYASGTEFGHWLRDALVSEMHGVKLGVGAIGLAREPWPHEPGYRDSAELYCDYPYSAKINRLILLDDRGLNSNWAIRFEALRNRIRLDRLVLPGDSSGSLVFIDRGTGGRMRDPSNIADIKRLLQSEGFRIIVPSEMSVDEMALSLRDVSVAVSVEGSHLNHLHLLARDGCSLITLQDPRRYSLHHKRVVDIYGGLFGVVVGVPDPVSNRYSIAYDDLYEILQLI
jgi:hypothetical protein